jgi:2-polyprenyl-3-methyl-5-hydroxy-6-metoxy-1,4-benzoquinol methylase
MILKLITIAQKILIHADGELLSDLYYKLATLHYKVESKGNLLVDTLNGDEKALNAAERHANMVVDILFKSSHDIRKAIIRAAAHESFKKNIILNASL